MTKRFNVWITCAHCGKQTSAETGFGRWFRGHDALRSEDGFVRTDTDHTILRHKRHGSREFQMMMDVEVKENGADPDQCQRDIFSFKNQLTLFKGKNIAGARTIITKRVRSVYSQREVNLRYFGFHLLQFEKTNPKDSSWIKWNGVLISEDQLVGLLAFNLDPYNPDRPMQELLRDRHKTKQYPLFDGQPGVQH